MFFILACHPKTEENYTMKKLLNDIVMSLVADPDQVTVTEQSGDLVTMLEISVDKKDIGKVIGKGGVTISALRHIFSCIARNRQIRVSLEVHDPSNPVSQCRSLPGGGKNIEG